MKIKKGLKYKAITECHSFKNLEDPTERGGFIIFEGDEYVVEYLYDLDGICFVNLGTYKNEFGETESKKLGLETFKNCFEEITE